MVDTKTAVSFMEQYLELVEQTVSSLDKIYDDVKTGVDEGDDLKELYYMVDEDSNFSDARFEILNMHQWAKIPAPEFRNASQALNNGENFGVEEYYNYEEELSTHWKNLGESLNLEPKELLDTMMSIMGTGEILIGKIQQILSDR